MDGLIGVELYAWMDRSRITYMDQEEENSRDERKKERSQSNRSKQKEKKNEMR